MNKQPVVLTENYDIKVSADEKKINSRYIKVFPVILLRNGDIIYKRTVRLLDVKIARRIFTQSKREGDSIPLVIKISSESKNGAIFMRINESYMNQIKSYLETGAIKPKNNSKDANKIKSMCYRGAEDSEGVIDLLPVFKKTGRQSWVNTQYRTFGIVNGKKRDIPFKEEINEENFDEYFYKDMVIPIMDVDFSQVVSSSKGFKCTISIRKIICNYKKKEDVVEIPDDIFDKYYEEPKEPEPKEPEPKEAVNEKEAEFEDVEAALIRLNMET